RKIRTGQITEKTWLLANSEVDQYMKQKYNRLSEKQRTLVDDLSPAGDAFTRSDIPLHANAMLKVRQTGSLEKIKELKKSGR
ncbi:hypothetical protein VWM66_10835, partial [Campylobacter jejuni]|uniref:hypothetical protein n=1 Tax=Campylobacter jejuni TaxID=197 RepID=UPI002F26569A